MATSNPKKLLITGPESSGKSTLVAELASQLKCNYVPEYARVYLRILGTEYREEDLDIILQGQLRTEKNASNTSTEFLVCDTGPLVVYIWSLEVYGRTSDLITKSLSHLKSYHKIFLCHPDIPWEPDDLRENPQDRDRLFSQI